MTKQENTVTDWERLIEEEIEQTPLDISQKILLTEYLVRLLKQVRREGYEAGIKRQKEIYMYESAQAETQNFFKEKANGN